MNGLAIFAKYPEPGKVKTRLAKDIGEKKAVEAYTDVMHSVINTGKDATGMTYISFTPKEKEADFKKLFADMHFFAQEGSDLGERMLKSFRWMLGKHEKAIIIGSDIIDLRKEDIEQAFKMLEYKDVVLGPAHDGGYYLIGMKQAVDIFSDIEWSTFSVLEETLKKVRSQGLSFTLLERKHDLDTVDEYKILKRKKEIIVKKEVIQ